MAGTSNIGTHEIGDHTPCYVIAEIGHNHQGSLEKARELFREAKLAGAHAVKLQKRDNRGLYTRAAYDKPYDNENSFGADLRRAPRVPGVRARASTRELQAYAKELGVDFFATAFDLASADFLAALDVPAYKIASGDLKSTPLLQHVARIGKPMIISTGGALHRGRAARLRRDHADQPAAGDPAVHRRLPGGVRGARPARHRDLPRALPGRGHRLLEPRQRHRHAGGRLHARRPDRREALHAEPRDEGHRPRVLARAGRPAQDGARPRPHLQGDGRRREEDLRERARADRQDGQEPGRRARSAERPRARPPTTSS